MDWRSIEEAGNQQGTSREQAGNKQGTSIETVHDPTTDLHDDRGCLRLPNTQRWCVRESFATCARMTGKIEGSGTRGTDVCHTAGEERCLRNWLNRWYAGVWREAWIMSHREKHKIEKKPRNTKKINNTNIKQRFNGSYETRHTTHETNEETKKTC